MKCTNNNYFSHLTCDFIKTAFEWFCCGNFNNCNFYQCNFFFSVSKLIITRVRIIFDFVWDTDKFFSIHANNLIFLIQTNNNTNNYYTAEILKNKNLWIINNNTEILKNIFTIFFYNSFLWLLLIFFFAQFCAFSASYNFAPLSSSNYSSHHQIT